MTLPDDFPSLRIKPVWITDGEVKVQVMPESVPVWAERGWTAVDDGNDEEADTDGVPEKENI